MSKVMAVATREFKQTVFRPVFILAVVGMPLLFGTLAVVAGVMMVTHEEPPLVGTVKVVADDESLVPALATEFTEEARQKEQERQAKDQLEGIKQGNISAGGGSTQPMGHRGEVDITARSADAGEAIDTLKQRVRDGVLLALAIVDEQVITTPEADAERPKFQLFVQEDVDSDNVSLIENAIGRAVVRVRAQRAGLDADTAMSMIKRPGSETSRTLAEGGERSDSGTKRELQQLIPMAFMILLWVGVLVAGQHLLMSTIEEKSNRVMEVLLSAASPMQLVTGKILGYGGVGLLIIGLYGGVAVGGGIVGTTAAGVNFTDWVNPVDLIYLVVFFFMAYFMIASLFAAVGSAVTDVREANTLVTPVMLLLMVPWMLWMPISQAPNGMGATIFSFVPPASPFAMVIRMTAEEPIPTWQIITSIVWGIVCTFGLMWGAAKIFRVGTLMYGKPPSPIELLKWLRYS